MYVSKENVSYHALLMPIILIVVISVFYGVGAEAVHSFIAQAVEPLINPEIYIEAVLKE